VHIGFASLEWPMKKLLLGTAQFKLVARCHTFFGLANILYTSLKENPELTVATGNTEVL